MTRAARGARRCICPMADNGQRHEGRDIVSVAAVRTPSNLCQLHFLDPPTGELAPFAERAWPRAGRRLENGAAENVVKRVHYGYRLLVATTNTTWIAKPARPIAASAI